MRLTPPRMASSRSISSRARTSGPAGEKPPKPRPPPRAPNISPRMSSKSTPSNWPPGPPRCWNGPPPEPAAGVAAHGLAPVGVDLAAVELLALLLVAEDVEGGADALEPLLGGLVAGVLVGMELLGELAERLADLVGVAPRATPSS